MTPQKVIDTPLPSNHVLLLPSGEAPHDDHCISKLLGTMEELWKALLKCKLAKKRGGNNVIDKLQIKTFIADNRLAGILLDGKNNKQPTTRLGFAQDNPMAADQQR
jgi:hypothetical protein